MSGPDGQRMLKGKGRVIANRSLSVGLGIWLSLVVVASARAQPAAPVHQLRTAELADEGFVTSTPRDLGHNRWSAHVLTDYGYKPLVLEVDGSTAAVPVRHQLVAQFAAAYGLWDRLVLYAALPVDLVMVGDSFGGTQPDGVGIGDVVFGARLRLLSDDRQPFALALQVNGTAPTAEATNEDQTMSGDDSATLQPEAVASLHFGAVRIFANVGVRVRKQANFPAVSINDELTYALATSVALPRSVWLWGELFGSTTVQDFGDREASPLELIVGPKWLPCSGLVVGGAMGVGLLPGYGTPLVRLAGTVGYRPPAGDRCQPAAPPPPPPDSDADGWLDSDDACPMDAEDLDGFEDEDGCPEADNDQDGRLDAEDACPVDAEDLDGFEDEDGCPEADNDQDGRLDAEDACPMDAEDLDGFEDEDGCPDPDNDGDGVLDPMDACPDEVGVAEAEGCPLPDRDGDTVPDRQDNCPDEAGPVENQGCLKRQLVVIHSTQLEILEKVFFVRGSARVQKRSREVLDNVAWVLSTHEEISHIRIEGHTDGAGGDRYNLRLSQKRAASVRAYLIRAGTDPARVEAVGYGETRPIESDDTSEGRAANRRVEFNIVDPELRTSETDVAAP